MSNYLQLYYFEGKRGEIFRQLYNVFKYQQYFKLSKNGNYKYLAYKLNGDSDISLCLVGIIKIDKGILIETSFPNQDGVFNRLWTLETFFGQITYTEVDNKELKNLNPIYYENPDSRDMELHALPADLDLLKNVLSALLIELSKNPKIINNEHKIKQLTSGLFS